MDRLIYVPIERLQERYSSQWDDWFMAAFDREQFTFYRVGDEYERQIVHGEFLDVIDTNIYKSQQLWSILEILKSFHAQKFKDTVTVFFTDAWFPGIQSLAYLRDGLGMKLKLKGMLHAGTYDPNDFLYKKKMGVWGRDFERSSLALFDEIFVATNYHKELIASAGLPTHNITLVPWPVEHEFQRAAKEKLVVFPHRLADEKQPEVFQVLEKLFKTKFQRLYQDVKWVRTKDVCKTKKEYYDLLARAKVSVSTALQETFGIAMVESLNAGCIPVAPRRLSYPEVLPNEWLYDNLDQAVNLIAKALDYSGIEPELIKTKEIKWASKIMA